MIRNCPPPLSRNLRNLLRSVQAPRRTRWHPPGQGTPRWAPPPPPQQKLLLPCLLTPAPHKPPRTPPATTQHKSLTTTPFHGLPWGSLISRSNLSWPRPAQNKNLGTVYTAPRINNPQPTGGLAITVLTPHPWCAHRTSQLKS